MLCEPLLRPLTQRVSYNLSSRCSIVWIRIAVIQESSHTSHNNRKGRCIVLERMWAESRLWAASTKSWKCPKSMNLDEEEPGFLRPQLVSSVAYCSVLYLTSPLIVEWSLEEETGLWVTCPINRELFCHSSPRVAIDMSWFSDVSLGAHRLNLSQKWFVERGLLNMKCPAIFKGSGARHSMTYRPKWRVVRLDICQQAILLFLSCCWSGWSR